MNRLNSFTWLGFIKTIIQGAAMLITLPVIIWLIVCFLNFYYSI